MTLDEFRQSLNAAGPPARLSHALVGLWWDAKGDWKRAHEDAATAVIQRGCRASAPCSLSEC